MAKKKSRGLNGKLLLGAGIGGGILVLIVIAIAAIFGVNLEGADLDELSDIFSATPEPGSPADRLPTVTAPAGNPDIITTDGNSWYEIYFTDPACAKSPAERVGGIDQIIADDIRLAQYQVDIAAFELDDGPIADALIELEDQGVLVRVVVDSDQIGPESAINRLRRNGISVVEDNRSALMHDKFIVVDGAVVWTGSMNYTSNGAYCNNNNAVRFAVPELAANYTAEMDEMYLARRFGPASPENTPHPQVTVDGVLIENYFGSEISIDEIVGARLREANSEILFLAFSFTNDFLGDTIFDKGLDGITVRGVFETSGSETEYSDYSRLADLAAASTNVAVRQDENGRLMHHKVMIIDRRIVIFGSYNFTISADDSNDENLVIVHDPVFASFFVEEFETVWAESSPTR